MDEADPVDSMNELQKSDPIFDAARSVMAQWRTVIGAEAVTVADVVKQTRPDFRDALLAVGGKGGTLNSRALGKWLLAQKDRIIEGAKFVKIGERQGVALWALRDQ